MSKSNDSKKNYDVGFGKPPKHTQWPPGQSGNPSGKKKKDDSILDLINKIAFEKLVANKNGNPQTISYIEAAIYALFAKAHTGNPQAFKVLVDLLGKEQVDAVAAGAYTMTEADLSVLKTSADWAAIVEQAEAELQSQVESGVMDKEDGDDDPASDD